MGEGQYGSPPPFFKLKKIPQEMTHTQREEGTGPQVLTPKWLRSTHSRSWEGHRKVGTGLGPGMAQLSQEECSPLFPSMSYKGGSKRGQTACSSPGSLEGDKRSFVLEASIQMTWEMTSPWPSEASGAPDDGGWQAVGMARTVTSPCTGGRSSSRDPPDPLPIPVSELGGTQLIASATSDKFPKDPGIKKNHGRVKSLFPLMANSTSRLKARAQSMVNLS